MRAHARINLDDTIVYATVLDKDRLAVCDKTRHFCIYTLDTQYKEHSFHFKQAYVHKDKASIAFSPDGKYIAFSEKDQSVVRIIDIEKQKLHHSFPTGVNKVETLCFDPHSHYLVAGCITGRVFLWNLFSTGQVSRLSSFPEYTPNILAQPKTNFVSAACFSPSGQLVATTGYGGSIVITNIHTEVSPKRITPSHVRINALYFVSEKTLCVGNIEGSVHLVDVQSAQITKSFQTGVININGFCLSNSSRYLLVSGSGTRISLIDLHDKKLIDQDYINLHSKISRITLSDDDVLIVGCEDGSLNIFLLYPQERLQGLIDIASYKKAYELLHQHPLLRESPLVKEMDDIWEEHLSEAIYKIETKRGDEVERTLKAFATVPSKQAIVKEVQSLTGYYERFKAAISSQNLALAYSMAEHIPLLKRTSSYTEMENAWNKAFLKAQSFIITGNTHLLFKTLEPYSKITTKLCFIQVLLHQPELFLEFVKLINTHEYDKIFIIAQKYPCLKEIESFQNIVITVNDLHHKCEQHIYASDFELAELELKELSHIPYMKETHHKMTHLFSLAKRFENLYKEHKLNNAYSLIDANPQLNELHEVQELEQEWTEKMKKAEKEALLGNTKAIKSILGELINLKSRSQKIGMLLRQSYLTQIKLLTIKRQVKAISHAINNYIGIFSYDTELHNLITKIKKDKIADISLTVEQELRRPRSLWLSVTKGLVPDTILEKQ